MTTDLVLITGATGHVGFPVLKLALEQGYKVRAVVRSEAKARMLRSHPALQALNKDSDLSFVIVPDFLANGAFEEAIQGVKYIIHIAAPLGSNAYPDGVDGHKHFVEPTLKSTINLLNSAHAAGTVKRIVVTSSVVAIVPPEALWMGAYPNTVYDAESRIPNIEAPYPNFIIAYSAGKTAALNYTENWVKTERPGFDVIHLFPSFVYGKHELCTSTADFMTSTNRLPLAVALGIKDPYGVEAMGSAYNHVQDCARVHVQALDPKVPGNQGFIVSAGMDWADTQDIVRKHFPDAVKSGVLPNTGAYQNLALSIDNSKTEKTFGFKHASYEDAVVSMVSHYLELLEKEQKATQGGAAEQRPVTNGTAC